MIDYKRYIPITWTVLYLGLKNNWLTAEEVTSLINHNSSKLNCDEETLIDINVNSNNKTEILEILRKQREPNENIDLRIWQLVYLLAIAQSELSIHQKLKEIEQQWSKFDYPEAWKDFIYYMPSEKANSEQDLYDFFLNFLDEEKKRLGLENI
jgi:hypothetical protein